MSSTIGLDKDDLLCVLGPDGSVDAETDPGLDAATCLRIYEAMVQTRIMDDRLMNLQRQGRIFFYLASSGQEACAVGAAAAMTPEDWAVPGYRQPGMFLYRGVTPKQIVAQCFGNAWDTTKGRQMPVHYSFKDQNMVSISSPIGTQVIQAAGVAMAMKRKGHKKICVTFIGDGGTSSNDFHAGMNFAAVEKAPCVIICENNGWAISVPVAKQTATETFAQKAIAYGMPGYRVDGNDALATYKAVRDARERAIRGEGPTFLEFVTFRMAGHSSSDDPKRYRPEEWCDSARQKDPIERFRIYLEGRGLLDAARNEALHTKCRDLVNQAIQENERVAKPELISLFSDVYKDMPPTLARVLDEEREARGEGRFP